MFDPLILARAIHMAASVLAAGTVAFTALVADPPALRRHLTVLVWAALAVAILSGLAWLVWLSADIYGAPIVEVCLHGGVWSVLIETRFGLVWVARLGLALLLGVLMLWPATRLLQLAVAASLLGLIALVGHAGATPGTAGQIHLASDMMHLLAAGVWVGALPALVMLLGCARHAGSPDWSGRVIAATRRFSLLGIISVSALLTSGVINSWNLLGGPRDLVTTDYGRLVLLKIGLFVAMVGIATVNRFHLTPRLPAAGVLKLLQRNSVAEVGLGLCALLIVGALGTLSPSGHAHSVNTPVPSGAAFAHIHTSEAMAEVTIEPGQTGPADAAIRVLREDFSEFPARNVQLTLEAPGAVSKITRNAAHLPDGTWRVNAMDLAQAGIWTVRLTILPQAGPPIALDAPIEIER